MMEKIYMVDKQIEEVMIKENKQVSNIEISEATIKSLIYVVRGRQVMMDSDLAMLYQVETGALNRSVKRNIKRFPEDFCFQLTNSEYENLKCQIGISSLDENRYGGRRYLPYVFTEQGISMLSAVLHSETAINVSIGIMRAFVEMRKFLANNSLMFERINELEVKQLAYQNSTDEKFEKIFDYISEHEEVSQKVFFDGQIYDAHSLFVDLVSRAEKKLVLIDNYVNIDTLNILAKKKSGVNVTVYTVKKTRLSETDVNNFNQQYPILKVKYTSVFHDRFLIIDDELAYHVGASIKDAGKKCFAISRIEDCGIVKDILTRLKLEVEND